MQGFKQTAAPPVCLDDNKLAAFIDGSAPAETQRLWEKHISNCPTCSAALAAVLIDLDVPTNELAGQAATHKSDQYSFALAAAEALTGQRPIAGKIKDQELHEATRQALLRALERDPALRFERIDDLVQALRQAVAAKAPNTKWIAAGALAAGAAIAAAVLASRGQAQPDCKVADDDIRTVWGQNKRDQVKRAFDTRLGPSAITQGVILQTDRAIAAWRDARVQVCTEDAQSTRSSNLGADKSLCLDRQLAYLGGIIDSFDQLSEGDLDRATMRIAEIHSSACFALDELQELQELSPLPGDEKTQAEVGDLLEAIERLGAKIDVGQDEGAIERLATLEDTAKRLHYEPALARIRFQQAQVEMEHGASTKAADLLRVALVNAEAGGDLRTKHSIARLLSGALQSLGELDESQTWLDYADAAAARTHLYDDPRLAADAQSFRGGLAWARGEHEAALVFFSCRFSKV